MHSHAWPARTMSCPQAYCEVGVDGSSLGTRRPSSQGKTPTQEGHGKPFHVSRHGAQIPEVSLCLPSPRKTSESTAGEPLGPFPGPGGPAAAEWLVQLSRRTQGHMAASLSRPRVSWTVTQTSKWERPLLGTDLKDPSHQTPLRMSYSPSCAAPQLCFLGQVISSLCLSFHICKMGMRQHLPEHSINISDYNETTSSKLKYPFCPSLSCRISPAFLPCHRRLVCPGPLLAFLSLLR